MSKPRISKIAALITITSVSFFAACNKSNITREVQQQADVANLHMESVASETWVDSWAASFLSTKVNGAGRRLIGR